MIPKPQNILYYDIRKAKAAKISQFTNRALVKLVHLVSQNSFIQRNLQARSNIQVFKLETLTLALKDKSNKKEK